MRSLPFRPHLAAAAALALAAAPAHAQDLGMIEALFDDVSAVTVFYQAGAIPASDDVTSDGPLHGAGTEVLINLTSTATMSYELGLGASYLRGYQSAEPTLDLRATLRALPTISLYATRERVAGQLSAYAGGSFGLVELWNAQAYGPSGQPWDVEARTFELGGAAGVYVAGGLLRGLFVEGGYRFRQFHSVKWASSADEELPAEWPRSLDFSGPVLSLGWQLQLADEEEDVAVAPPAPAGTWMLERVDGAPLPALLDSAATGRREVLHGVLRLRPEAEGRGTWALDLHLRDRAGTLRTGQPDLRLHAVQEQGTYVAEGGILRLTADAAPAQAQRAERLAGRLYLHWGGHVLAFAPGTAP